MKITCTNVACTNHVAPTSFDAPVTHPEGWNFIASTYYPAPLNANITSIMNFSGTVITGKIERPTKDTIRRCYLCSAPVCVDTNDGL